MPDFVPSDLIARSVSSEARSALPDAPVIPEDPPRARHRSRARVSAALRSLARVQLGLAERLDPSRTPPHGGQRTARAG